MLKRKNYTASVYCTEMEVTEAKGVPGVVVNFVESNEDVLQSQSASAPNPQNRYLTLPVVARISFP